MGAAIDSSLENADSPSSGIARHALSPLRVTLGQIAEANQKTPEVLGLVKPRWIDETPNETSGLSQCISSIDRVIEGRYSPSASAHTDILDQVAQTLRSLISRNSSLLQNERHREALRGKLESIWLRARIEDCIRRSNEDINAPAKLRDEKSREALLPNGRFYELARSLANRVEIEDFQIDDLSDTSVFQLRESAAFEIQQRIVRELFGFLDRDAHEVDLETSRIADHAAKSVGDLLGWNLRFHRPRFDNSRIQDFAATSALAPISHQNEFPRVSKGAFAWQVFIQPAMMAGMLLMPFWILMMNAGTSGLLDKGIKRSGLLLVIFAFLYPGYYFYQRQKVPKDRANRIRRELLKARQVLKTEIERAFRASLDEHKRGLSEHWRKVSEELRQQMMDCLNLSLEARISHEVLNERLRLLNTAMEQISEIRHMNESPHREVSELDHVL